MVKHLQSNKWSLWHKFLLVKEVFAFFLKTGHILSKRHFSHIFPTAIVHTGTGCELKPQSSPSFNNLNRISSLNISNITRCQSQQPPGTTIKGDADGKIYENTIA